jgi:hypothetical protein
LASLAGSRGRFKRFSGIVRLWAKIRPVSKGFELRQLKRAHYPIRLDRALRDGVGNPSQSCGGPLIPHHFSANRGLLSGKDAERKPASARARGDPRAKIMAWPATCMKASLKLMEFR